MISKQIICWFLTPLALILAALVYQALLNPLFSLGLVIMTLGLGAYLYKNQVAWWYSTFFFLVLSLSGFFYYGVVTPDSWVGYAQNISLIPLWYRLLFFILFWVVISIPFIVYLGIKKKNISKIIKPSLICLFLILALNGLLDSYYTYKLIDIGNTPTISKILIETKNGNPTILKKRLKRSNHYESPDAKYKLEFNHVISKFDVLNKFDHSKVMTMSHWVIGPGEVFWLTNNNGEATHIIYQWTYDQDDLSKIYISNLKTKKTVLLSKGNWLHDLVGKIALQQESTIIDCTGVQPKLIRKGAQVFEEKAGHLKQRPILGQLLYQW